MKTGVLHPRIAEIVEQLHAVNSQHHRQIIWLTPSTSFRVIRADTLLQTLPGNQTIHPFQKYLPTGPPLLALVFHVCKCRLLHHLFTPPSPLFAHLYYNASTHRLIQRFPRLIESFLVNIPVPPVFLYEKDFARYEVMDGQQRVTAILEYFENQYALRGLKILTSLIGKRFHDLPREVRAGLERRSLPAIILLKESTPSNETAILLRRQVFERLNTGGIRLNAQEVRNSVHSGSFNNLLLELSRHHLFTTMWDIPPLEPNENAEPSGKLRRNVWYRQMRDVELVLRVFALLDPENIGGGMRSTLDNAMVRYSKYSESGLRHLKTQFLDSLTLAHAIGGNGAFRLPSPGPKRGRLSASLFDGIMVALMRKLDHADRVRDFAAEIGELLQSELANPKYYSLVAGRANTREATLRRSKHIEDLIESVTGA